MAAALPALLRLLHPALDEPDGRLVERFAAAGEQAAFATLVRRHGPLVWGMCRRVLRDSHLAEDAFQATFLVLARKAGRLRVTGSLASWLFAVARRVALAARRTELRQHRLQLQARPPASSAAPAGEEVLLQALDEELARLPDKYGAPLLACYLHGRTQDEAARELGWSLSTLRRRLERGRELLRVRLTARGATLAAGWPAVALARPAVPEALFRATLTTAWAARGGAAVPGLVGALAKEVMTMTVLTKWCLAIAGLVVVGGAAIGLGRAGGPAQQTQTPPARVPSPAAEERRDRYNDRLPPRAVARMGTVGFRHPGMCQTVSYALGGSVIVSTGFGSARVWDAETGQERTVLGGYSWNADEIVNAAGVSGDGKALIVHGLRRIAPGGGLVDRSYVWDLAAGRELRPFIVKNPVADAAWRGPHLFAASGTAMAEVRHDGDIWLWDEAGKPTHVLAKVFAEDAEPWHPRLATFAPDGKALVTADAAQRIQVWDVTTGKHVRSFGGKLPRPDALAFTPDGKYVATVAQALAELSPVPGAAVPEKVRVWELSTGKLVRAIDWGNAANVVNQLFLAFSPDGQVVIAANEYSSHQVEVRQWRRADGELLRRWEVPGRNIRVSSLAVRPDGRTLAVGAGAGLIRLFDLDMGKEKTPTNLHLGRVTALAFAADGRELRSLADDGTARTWNAATGEPLHAWRYDGENARLTPDGSAVLDAHGHDRSGAHQLSVRDPRTGRVERVLGDLNGFVQAPDGKAVWARSGRRDTLRRLDLTTGASGAALSGEVGQPLAVTPDGRLLVTQDGQRFVGWDTVTGKQRFAWSAVEQKLLRSSSEQPQPHDQLHAVSLSPDGRLLAVIVHRSGVVERDDQASAYLCALATGKILWQVKEPENALTSLAFRPDGKVLAVGGLTVKLYDVTTGKALAELEGHRGFVSALAFSADGRRLASGAHDGTALVWEVR